MVLLVLPLFGSKNYHTDLTESGSARQDGDTVIDIVTDKSRYNPGEEVRFFLSETPTGPLTVRYRWLDSVVKEETISTAEWSWSPPATDFKGYLVEVLQSTGGVEKILCTTGVDVSSDWTRFPRYGFLHYYGTRTESEIRGLMEYLTRHHINGLQYYDWLYDHHRPLAGTPAQPWNEWPDLMNHTIYKSTVDGFINAGHDHNIASMWYDLCFGALDTWPDDGVSLEWFIFNKPEPVIADINRHSLSAPFRSSIYILDPSNAGWLDYFRDRVSDLYKVFDFDGYHIDQLGDRGTVYNYKGGLVDLRNGYEVFLNRMKAEFPEHKHVFNAVSRWGQSNIAAGEPDFFYNEIWDTDDFSNLSDVLFENLALNPAKKSVVAAYVNYDVSNGDGYINTPGVLMGNAALFALGGSRIELGEHMLTSEYFPKNNLKMSAELQTSITRYYDFLTAYENILRDGGVFNTEWVSVAASGSYLVGTWPPKRGEITKLCKSVGGRQVIHLLNFTNATTLDPRDADGIQSAPESINSLEITVDEVAKVNNVWVATPDADGKMYEEVHFSQQDGKVTLVVPALKYWTMVVLEK
jgi:dextranase